MNLEYLAKQIQDMRFRLNELKALLVRKASTPQLAKLATAFHKVDAAMVELQAASGELCSCNELPSVSRAVEEHQDSQQEQKSNLDECTEILTQIVELLQFVKQEQAFDVLQDKQEWFEQIMENTPQVVWIKSPDMCQLLYISPAYEQIWGRSRELLYSHPESFLETIHPDDREHVRLVTEQRLWDGYDEEYRILQPNGTVRWIRERGLSIRDSLGEVYQYVGIAEDITEYKQDIEALRESEDIFRQIADNIKEVFWISSLDSKDILYISPAYEEIWDKNCQSLDKTCYSFLDSIHPQDRAFIFAILGKKTWGVNDEEYQIIKPDGSICWIRDRAFQVKDLSGRVTRIVKMAEDITERKRIDEEVCKALEKEKELNQLKSRFLWMTSHEFRNPLTTILSSAQLIERYRKKWSEEQQLIHLHRIQEATQEMMAMLDDLMLLSKAEAGKVAFQPTPLDVVQFCQQLIEQMQQGKESFQRIVFEVKTQFTISGIYMDKNLLRQILSNLLSNALKYSPRNSIVRLTLSCHEDKTVFQIQDFGIGIPSEDLPYLFDSFHRAKNVSDIPGTGLGLTIVKKCVEYWGGEMAVESEIGVGTTFTVVLPLVAQPHDVMPNE